MSPSKNHSFVHTMLIGELLSLKQYSVFTELSIEIEGKEYVPDISVYSKPNEIDFVHDIIRVKEMPLLAVEVQSPSQGIQELIDKIEIYLNAGIQSCWLVTPATRSIAVFNEIKKKPVIFNDKVIDEKLNISLPLDDIFPF
jgi:Uma2 family endonuclease